MREHPRDRRRRAWVGRHYAHVAGCDKVKTTVALSGYALRRFAVSEALVERGIVVEKAGVTTITFITRPADHAPVPRAPLREVDTRASG